MCPNSCVQRISYPDRKFLVVPPGPACTFIPNHLCLDHTFFGGHRGWMCNINGLHGGSRSNAHVLPTCNAALLALLPGPWIAVGIRSFQTNSAGWPSFFWSRLLRSLAMSPAEWAMLCHSHMSLLSDVSEHHQLLCVCGSLANLTIRLIPYVRTAHFK